MLKLCSHYPDDITDKEWELIEPILHKYESRSGRKPKYAGREMMNAIFYLMRTGCSWRHLPHDFPPWNVVYTQFARWRDRGIFERMHDGVKETVRQKLNRNTKASAGIIDSQSVKTTEKGGVCGYDAGKKIKGCNRQIQVIQGQSLEK